SPSPAPWRTTPRGLSFAGAPWGADRKTERPTQAPRPRPMRGRPSPVIAHRLSPIQAFVRIVVLHRARIREEASHAGRLALRGLYHRLYQLQYLGGHATRSAATPRWNGDGEPVEVAEAPIVDTRSDLT